MKMACIAALAVLLGSSATAATVRLDAFATRTFNASDLGPPAVPLVTDDEGNVLNPAVGQVYEIAIALFVSDLGTLPNGKDEKGMASVEFDVTLHGASENAQLRGWYLEQQLVDLNGLFPGGSRVPLWVDLCDCGMGGLLADIAVGVDVADFPRADVPPNGPQFDLRRTVGQGLSAGELVGWIFVDYLGQNNSHLNVSIDSFEVHDLATTHPGIGTAIGDTVRFVPEPHAWMVGLVSAIVAAACGAFRWLFRDFANARTKASYALRAHMFEPCEDRRLLSATFQLSATQPLMSLTALNVSDFQVGGVPLLENENVPTHQDEMGFSVNPANPLMIAGATHRIIPDQSQPNDPTLTTIDVVLSTDGGTTWSNTPINDDAEGLLIEPGQVVTARGDPVIAFDSTGNLYVGYVRVLTESGAWKSDIVVAARAPADGAFSQFRIVEQTDGFAAIHQPRLAVGRDGSDLSREALYVVYNRYFPTWKAVRISASNDLQIANDHLVFLDEAEIVTVNDNALNQPPVASEDVFPDVAVGPFGDVHVVWHAQSEGKLYYDYNPNGIWGASSSFGTDEIAASLVQSLLKTAKPVAPTNGIHAGPVLDIDQANGRLYLSYVDCPGATASSCANPPPIPPSPPYTDYDVFVRSLDTRASGAQWSERVKVDPSTGTEFLPWLTVDQTTGAVYVVYYSTELDQAGGNTKAHVKLAVSTDRGATFSRTQLSTTPSDETPPPGVPDPNPDDYLEYIGLAARDGTAHAFWAANAQQGEDLDAWHAVASLNGAAAGVNNVLYVTGDESGAPTNDSINVSVYRATPTSPEWVQVFVGGARQFTGLRSSITKIYVFGLGGTDSIFIDSLLSSMAFQASNSAPRVYRVSVVDQAGQDEYVVPARDRVHDAGEQLRTVPIYLPKQIKIKFTEGMLNVAASRFTITTDSGTPVPFTTVYTSATHTATLTLTNTITAAQQLVVTALDTLRDLSSVRLDGNWTNPTWINTNDGDAFPSGDGAALGNFVFRLMFVPGDADRNGVVDIPDLNAVRNNFGAPTPAGLVERWLFGDVTQDGQVAIDDLNEVRNNFGLGFTGWGQLAGGGGGMMMMSGGGGATYGEEALRQALRDYYLARLSGQEQDDEFDSLLHWNLLGDEEWWKITLGGE